MRSKSKLCVFAGAANGSRSDYQEQVRRLGGMLAARSFDFIYGGGRTGLMGAFAGGALEAGGHITGIIPKFLENLEVGNRTIQKLEVVDGMHERKARMYKDADGFVVLPGGLGTLDELMEVLTWNQLGLINAPVFVLNLDGYWDNMIAMLSHAADEGFVHSKGILHFTAAPSPDDLIDQIDSHYTP